MKLYYVLFLFFLIGIFATSCVKKPDQAECEELSMKVFKGVPSSINDFKEYCQDYKVKYTGNLCQKALASLIMGSDEKKLKEKFGNKIMNCFTQNDLDNFLVQNLQPSK